MDESFQHLNQYEANQDVRITRKEDDQEWSFDTWGDCRFQTENGATLEGNFYKDPRITRRLFTEPILKVTEQIDKTQPTTIADFGGGAGIMLSQINQQLKEAGFEQTKPILLDADKKKIEHSKQSYPEIDAKVADIFHLPLEDSSVDVGVSRNLMQYFAPPSPDNPQPNQLDILKEMFRVLKPGGTLVLSWPGAYKYSTDEEKSRAGAHDIFWSQVTYDRVIDYQKMNLKDIVELEKEDPDSRRSPRRSLEPITDADGKLSHRVRALTPGEVMAEFAKQTGFEITNGEEINWVEFRYTLNSLIDRFGQPNEDNRRWLENNFDGQFMGALKRYLKNAANSFDEVIDWNGHNAIRLPISRLILTKPNEQETNE